MLSLMKYARFAVTTVLGVLSVSVPATATGAGAHQKVLRNNGFIHGRGGHHPNHEKRSTAPLTLTAFLPPRLTKNAASGVSSRYRSAASSSGNGFNKTVPNNDSRRQHHALMGPLWSSSSDTIVSASANGSGSAEEMAQQLREKARALRLEANAAEEILRSTVEQKKEAMKKEADEMIDLLLGSTPVEGVSNSSEAAGSMGGAGPTNNSIPTAQTLALRIKEHNLYSPSKLQKVVERLHERETSMMTGAEGYLSKEETSLDGEGMQGGGGFVLGDYENNSMDYKMEETDRISGLLDSVLEAVQILHEEGLSTEQSDSGKSTELGSKLRIRVADLRQSRDALLKRRVDTLASSSAGSKNDGSINGYIQSSIDGDDDDSKNEKKRKEEKMLKRLVETPSWLPQSLSPFAATSPVEVSISNWKMIKTDLLVGSEFVCTSWDCTDVAAIYRGRLPRASTSKPPVETEDDDKQNENPITAVFEDLQARLEDHDELSKRVRLFLVDDFEWRPSVDTANYGSRLGGWEKGEERGPPPVIIALAKEVEPEQESERSLGTKSLAAFSTLTTIFTTFAYALGSYALNPTFFNSVVKENDVTAVPLCLPIFAGVLALSALHEAGHIIAAKKNGVKLGLPVPLPSLQVGSFGSITPMRSFPKTRKAIFDVAVSGPGLSMLVSIILLVSGLNLTMNSDSLAAFPVVPAALMKSSLLIGSIVSAVAPKVMLVPLSQPIPVHPMFLVGLSGLFMSAVNLLPIGRLDGGRCALSVWGRRSAALVSFFTLLVMVFYSFSGISGTIMFWGALVVLTQRLGEIPAVDEVTDVGTLRMRCYLVLLALSLMTLAPFPGGYNV